MIKLFRLTKLRWQYVIIAILSITSVVGVLPLAMTNWQKGQFQNACVDSPPNGSLSSSNITTIDLTERPKESKDVSLNPNRQFVGYSIVSPKSGQLLQYDGKDFFCGWLFKGNEMVPLDRELEEKTKYTFQVGLPPGRSITYFRISMWLKPKEQTSINLPPKPNETSIDLSGVKEEQKKLLDYLHKNFDGTWLNDVLVNVLVNIASSILVMFFVGSQLKTVTEHFRDFKQTKESKDLRLFWFGTSSPKSGKSELPKYTVVNGSTSNSGAENFISEEYSKAKEIIIRFLEDMGCTVEEYTLLPNETLNQNLFDGNVVLLTGEAHPILGFEKFVDSIKLPYFYSRKGGQNVMRLFRRVENFSGDQIEYRQASVMDSTDKNTISLAFGTLTRLVDPDTTKIVIVLNGGHGFGVSAPAYFLTNYDNRKSSNLNYLDFSKLNREIHSYQIVLEANNSKKIKRPGLNSRDLHLSTWIRLEIGRSDLNSAIADLCNVTVMPDQQKSAMNVQSHNHP